MAFLWYLSFWYLAVSFGAVQIITTSKLFAPTRNRFRTFVEGWLGGLGWAYEDVRRYSGYLGCPMCVGVPVGFVLALLMGVHVPLAWEPVDGFWGEFQYCFESLLASFAVSGTAYILTMAGRVLEKNE